MKRRKSYLTNFPTSTLFIILEQNIKEQLELEMKLITDNNPLLKERVKQIKLTIEIARNTIIERYLETNISLNESAKLLVISTGIREDIYKELFTLKVLESNEMIPLELLEGAFSKLDISQLMMIMRAKENTVYGEIATKNYDEVIFDVEPDVLEEYIHKKRLDRRKEC